MMCKKIYIVSVFYTAQETATGARFLLVDVEKSAYSSEDWCVSYTWILSEIVYFIVHQFVK